jgi:hypothetical protein
MPITAATMKTTQMTVASAPSTTDQFCPSGLLSGFFHRGMREQHH